MQNCTRFGEETVFEFENHTICIVYLAMKGLNVAVEWQSFRKDGFFRVD
jgi:hypothetical protein